MSGTTNAAAWLDALRQRLQQSQERRLVRVQGTASFTREWARAAILGLEDRALLWVGAGADAVSPDQARQYLGREFSVLVWDARAGMHPDGLGALAGTLCGGGVMLLLTPTAGNWQTFEDPDYRRLSAAPREKHFLARIDRVLAADPSVLLISAGQPPPPLPNPGPGVSLPLPTLDQQRALSAIRKVRHGHRRRPLVITADRGRGKSAVLGMAAAELVARHNLDIAVTAPRPGALETFWEHAAAGLAGATGGADCLSLGAGRIRYFTPHRLLQERPRVDLLLVDEAAAIPMPMLARLLDHYARIVFASTVHGYEGSGRGFALRFRNYLTTKTPQWQALTLTQPVRWAASDPLEPLLNRLLLLDAELADPARLVKVGNGPQQDAEVELISWPRSARASDEHRLREVFGLLVNAHYQTTPDDLRLLLDDCSSHFWLALQSGTVVGAAWVMAEGPLEESLALAVRRGERRTRGQLLPQALAAYGGDSEAATLRYWRLARVAVHPLRRRCGLGRRLVLAALEDAGAARQDIFGTSFGVSADLIAFWRRCGLLPLRLGLGRDAASGAPSMMLGQGLTVRGEALCQRQNDRFAEHWPTLLAAELQTLEPGLIWQLNTAWTPVVPWSPQDALEVEDFATGFRPLALTRLPLQRLTWRQQPNLPGLLGEDATLWCRAILQQIPESNWQHEGLVSGRKEGLTRLQRAAARLLKDYVCQDGTDGSARRSGG